MIDTNLAVTGLRSTWHALPDLDRSQAVKSALQSGTSLRALAAVLNCSPALLTHLLQAGQAPPEDCVLARQRILSTRELVRRAKLVGTYLTALHGEEFAFERERAAFRGCKSILNWFAERRIANDSQSMVIEKALQLMSPADRVGLVTPVPAKTAGPSDEPARPCLPSQSEPADADFVAGIAGRLVRWVVQGILDPRVRQRALQLAGEQPREQQGSGATHASFDG